MLECGTHSEAQGLPHWPALHGGMGWDGMVTGAGAGHEAIVVLSEKEEYLI